MRPVLQGSTAALRFRRWRGEEDAWSDQTVHAGLELAWARSGSLAYRIGRREVVVPAGALIVVPEGVEHSSLIAPGTEADSVHLSTEMVVRLSEELGPRLVGRALEPGVVFSSGRLPNLGDLVAAALLEPGRATRSAEDLAQALGLEALRQRTRDETLAQVRDRRVLAALERLWDGISDELDVDELARAAGMSRFHFSRVFRERVGFSPYQFVLELRLAKAASLLRQGEHAVTEAATLAGFTDLSRFGQLFRRRFGCTPREYARTSARNQCAFALGP